MTFIYSGKCRFCEIGIGTPFRDMVGEKLHTGDIVAMFTEDEHGMCSPPRNLSAIVMDKYTTYSDGKIELKSDISEPFVMGIKNCKAEQLDGETVFRQDENSVWRVMRLKSYRDVIPGEHWTEWGFNYREEE